MKLIQLNFSQFKQRQRQQSNSVLIVILAVILMAMFVEQTRVDKESDSIATTIAISQGRQTVKHEKPTEYDLRKMKLAALIQHKLNFPWHQLLAAIEAVKQQTAQIHLMSMQPNPSKREVIIAGEADNLKAMLDFMSLLEQHSILSNVLLINQHQLASKKGQNLAFTIKMGWTI